MFCAAVLDAISRRIIGWSIDSRQDSTLVVNALDMAIRNRRPEPGGIVHADHGVQFTSWAFGDKIPLRRAHAIVRQRRRRPRQRDDGIFLVIDADRAPQPQEVDDTPRARDRDLRLHRDLPQPPAAPFLARLSHPNCDTNYSPRRTPSRPETHHRKWKPNSRAGQDDTHPCSSPILQNEAPILRFSTARGSAG